MIKLKTVLVFSLSFLLMVMLSLIFIYSLKNTKSLIENQIQSNVQDSAYAIGVSFSLLNEESTQVDKELIINSIFDSGYYEYIQYRDNYGNVKYEAMQELIVKGVPSLFIHAIPIHMKEVVIDLNQGWKKIGTLHVKPHKGHIYYQLYQNFKSLIIVFTFISIVFLLLLYIMIHFFLTSLNKIKLQAEAIMLNKFLIEKDEPFIVEFNILTKSMNRMVKKVELLFQSQVDTLHKYQDLLYKDKESGLVNRRYLVLKLKEMIHNQECTNMDRKIAIISIDGLVDIKENEGYYKYKEMFSEIQQNIESELDNRHLLVRLSENELAVLFDTNIDNSTATTLKKLEHVFTLTHKNLKIKNSMINFHVGVTPLLENDQASKVLSRADYSLQLSKDSLNDSFLIDNEHINPLIVKGKEVWREEIQEIFDEDRWMYVINNVTNSVNNTIYHHEALLRVKHKDLHVVEVLGLYHPMARSIHQLALIEQNIINKLLAKLNDFESAVAVNVSADFIKDSNMLKELDSQLAVLSRNYEKKIHFEIQESDVIENISSSMFFRDMIAKNSQIVGVDGFTGVENLDYIRKIRPKYIKIAYHIIEELYEHNRAILVGLNILTDIMDIDIIVIHLKNEVEYIKCKKMLYNFVQFDYIDI